MKKINILTIIMSLVFLVVFNVVFFVAGGTNQNSSVWISYVFIHIAYFMMVLTPIIICKGKSRALFGYSIYGISSTYFFLELVTGIIFILFLPDNYKVAIIVQICMLGLYAVILIANLIANEKTANAEKSRQIELNYIKNATSKLSDILSMTDNEIAKKKIEKAYDALSASPVKSHPDASNIEKSILLLITQLEDFVCSNDIQQVEKTAEELIALINGRNRKLKLTQ